MQQFIATKIAASRQYQGLERLAWATLVVSFLVFVAIVISLPYAFDWAIERIRQDVPVEVRVISGQVFVLEVGSPSWVVRSESTQLNPGDRIGTHETAHAFLVLADGSTVYVFPDSEIALVESNVVRYRPDKVQIELDQVKGYSRIAVAPVLSPERRDIRIQAPFLAARLQEGSFAVEVIAEDRSSLSARLGNAVVEDGERELAIASGERVTTENGRLPEAPLPAAQDLMQMGDFTALSPDWKDFWTEEDYSERPPKGTITPRTDGLFLKRVGSGHGETVLVQQVNRPVWDFEKLILSVRVKAIRQNLPGGGTAGFEYPILIRVNFRDVSGSEKPWYHGFYYLEPTEDDGFSTKGATLVTRDEWFNYEIDLLEIMPRPTYIRTIEIVATGWSYEGAIQHLSLVAE